MTATWSGTSSISRRRCRRYARPTRPRSRFHIGRDHRPERYTFMGRSADDRLMEAAYVFRVAVRLDPPDAAVDPDRFETTLEIPASDPGTDGWLFFRDRLWRGEVGDEPSFRRLTEERLGVADAPGVAV